jgi:hypothetical protein
MLPPTQEGSGLATSDPPTEENSPTEQPTGVTLRMLRAVQKGQPHLTIAEQLAEAEAIASSLPPLRSPKQSAILSPLTVRQRISRFIETIRNVPTSEKKALSGYVGMEKRELFKYYELLYVRSSLTEYRRAVREAYGDDHPVIKYLHLSKSDIAGTNDADRAQVRERKRNLIPIDADALIDKAIQLLDESTPFAIATGLVLLTGRRPYEIFKSGAIEKASDTHVRVVGQAKLKTAPMVVMTIPVLADVDRVIDAWAKLRTMQWGKGRIADLPDSKTINAITGKPMNTVMVRFNMRDGYNGQLTPKDLRAAYAEIAHAYFGRKQTTKDLYFHDILGHSATDERSTGTYLRFCLEGHAGDTDAQNEAVLRNILVSLYRFRDAATERVAQEQFDERISYVESQLSFTSRDTVWRAVGRKSDPAIEARAQLVRSLADQLSPHQERLLRMVANAQEVSLKTWRPTIKLLVDRGILENTSEGSTETIGLTDIGHEVRAELPEWDIDNDE